MPVCGVHIKILVHFSSRRCSNLEFESLAPATAPTKPARQPDSVHTMLLEKLRKYLFVGGMPECVSAFLQTNRLHGAAEIQAALGQHTAPRFFKVCAVLGVASTETDFFASILCAQVRISRLIHCLTETEMNLRAWHVDR